MEASLQSESRPLLTTQLLLLPCPQAERLSRDATLLRLATSVQGVYVPQFYEQLEG